MEFAAPRGRELELHLQVLNLKQPVDKVFKCFPCNHSLHPASLQQTHSGAL